MLKLKFTDGSQDSLWLVDEVLKIGSAADNGVVLQHEGVMPRHAAIILRNNEVFLKSLDENAVTTINGVRLKRAGKLSPGDQIEIGGAKLEIIRPSHAAPVQAPISQKQTPETPVPVEASERWGLETMASWARQRFFYIDGPTLIGRDEQCDIVVPVNQLSRQHARLMPSGGFLVVKDLDSTNGTFLNGERIQTGRARPGDRLRFDVVTFNVVGPAEDNNQTVVRPAGTAERWAAADSAASPPDRHQGQPSASTTSRRQATADPAPSSQTPKASTGPGPKTVAGTHQPKAAARPAKPAQSPQPEPLPEKPKSTLLPIMLALLVAVCIAAGLVVTGVV